MEFSTKIILAVFIFLFQLSVAVGSRYHSSDTSSSPMEWHETTPPEKVVTDKEKPEQPREPIEYTIKTSKETFHILLEQRTDVAHPHISVDNGDHIINLNERKLFRCQYTGKFKNGKGRVIMDTCNGLKGVLIDDDRNIFFVEPAGNGLHNITSYADTTQKDAPDIFHVSNEKNVGSMNPHIQEDIRSKQTQRKRSLKKTASDPTRSKRKDENANSHRQKRSLNWDTDWKQGATDKRNGAYFDMSKVTKYISTAYVIDNSMYNFLGRDVVRIFDFVNTISNYMNMLLAPTGFKFTVTNLLIWIAEDKIDMDGDILHEFESYDSQKLRTEQGWKHDYAQLLTRKHFGLAGLSSFESMCQWNAVGIVYAWSDNPYQLAGTVAHELGHTFGLDHYSTTECNCPSSAPCVMTYVNSHTVITDFTDCSKRHLIQACKNGFCSCLLDPPVKIYNAHTCGNGFIEEGEDCDCGDIVSCTNKCCDPVTCKKVANAQCAHGKCCADNCKYKEAGTSCRESISACDIRENCTGLDSECPLDVGVEDFTSCDKNDEMYCYGAACIPTLDKQCKRIWGNGAMFGGEGKCYGHGGQSMNTWGMQYGHCGEISYNRWKPCTESNSRCGKLQCYGHFHGVFVLIGRGRMTTQYHYTSNKCRAAITNVIGAPDPTMALTGTKCGDGKACLHNRCVPVKDVIAWHGCNKLCKHGICTQLGVCYCRPGYGGTSCSITDDENRSGKLYYPSCHGKCNVGACNVVSENCWCPPGRRCPYCTGIEPLNVEGKVCLPVASFPGIHFGERAGGISCGSIYSGSVYKNGCKHKIGNSRGPLPHFILNLRDYITWTAFHGFANSFLCRCAEKARHLGYKSIGLQYWGECWASKFPGNDLMTTDSTGCYNTRYQTCGSDDGLCVGTEHSTVLYTISV